MLGKTALKDGETAFENGLKIKKDIGCWFSCEECRQLKIGQVILVFQVFLSLCKKSPYAKKKQDWKTIGGKRFRMKIKNGFELSICIFSDQ